MYKSIFVSLEDTVVKVGLDDGQGVLKVCLQVLTKDKEPTEIENERSKYSQVWIFARTKLLIYYEILFKGVASKENKEGGVKKLFIIAACPDVQEIYGNISVILQELQLEAVDFTITGDIKIGNIF